MFMLILDNIQFMKKNRWTPEITSFKDKNFGFTKDLCTKEYSGIVFKIFVNIMM